MRSLATRSGTSFLCAARSWALVGFHGVGNLRFIRRHCWWEFLFSAVVVLWFTKNCQVWTSLYVSGGFANGPALLICGGEPKRTKRPGAASGQVAQGGRYSLASSTLLLA